MVTTILVVDNDRAMSDALRSVLEEEGFSVIAAKDAQKAIESLAGRMPDLILSEVRLPGVDGFTLLQHLRQSREGVLTPFVFLTVRGTREDVFDGLRQGADAYLTKPITGAELLASVKSRLDRFAEIKSALA